MKFVSTYRLTSFIATLAPLATTALLLSTSAAAQTNCPFNASGLSQALLLRDGLLLARYAALGANQAALADNTGATESASQIAARIGANAKALDVNGNGAFDMDDALIITRYLAGFRGDALRASASDAQRIQGYEIEDFIAQSCGLTVCDLATGRRVLEVGAGKTYATPSAAAAVAQADDVIKIAAGDYVSNYATWSANNLAICGAGGRARLLASAAIPNGKAIWVISGNNAVVDNIEFHNATVPDRNGAGIRSEGVNLTVINSGFHSNENGILSGAIAQSTITVRRSEFRESGYGDGLSHNLYIGNIAKLDVSTSYFNRAKIGHNLKSRARVNVIENSYFMDGASGTSSYLLDFSNGGDVHMRGNMLHKGPNTDNTTAAIAFGMEGLTTHPVNTLTLTHNTIVMQRSSGSFAAYILAPATVSSISLQGNLLASTGTPALTTGGFLPSNVVQQNNLSADASHLLPGAANTTSPNFWPSATLLPQTLVTMPVNAVYTADAPKPFVLRPLTPVQPRRIGALQTAP